MTPLISGGGNGGSLWDLIIGVVAMTLALVPFVLIAAALGLFALSLLTSVILAITWTIAKLNISANSPWRTYIVDIIGGILATILGGMFAGLTLTGLVIGIIISIIYAVLDAFILAYRRDKDTIYA